MSKNRQKTAANPRQKADGTSAHQKPAIVLLSGGLDSTTSLAIAQSQGFACHALSFDYGQRHAYELQAARRIAARYKVVEHVSIKIDLRIFGGSALTSKLSVPKDRPASEMSHGIPVTYVPARNTVFLSFALAYAEVKSAFDIFIGVNALDYSGYPDCRPEYIEAYELMANLATKAGVENTRKVKIHAPLIHLTKADIIQTAARLGVDLSLTHSCYDPSPKGLACGHCDACLIRKKGFVEAGVVDVTRYTRSG